MIERRQTLCADLSCEKMANHVTGAPGCKWENKSPVDEITRRAREFCAATDSTYDRKNWLAGEYDDGPLMDRALFILTACQDQFGALPSLPEVGCGG